MKNKLIVKRLNKDVVKTFVVKLDMVETTVKDWNEKIQKLRRLLYSDCFPSTFNFSLNFKETETKNHRQFMKMMRKLKMRKGGKSPYAKEKS